MDVQEILQQARAAGAASVKLDLPDGTSALIKFSAFDPGAAISELEQFCSSLREIIQPRPQECAKSLFLSSERLTEYWKSIFKSEISPGWTGRKVRGWISRGELKTWRSGKSTDRGKRGFWIAPAFFRGH